MKRIKLYKVSIVLILSIGNYSCSDEEDHVLFPNRELEDIQVIYSDIELFWSVFDHLGGEYLANRFEEEYFLNGTAGLEQYFIQRIRTGEAMTKKLQNPNFLDYYTSIRTHSLDTEILKNNIMASLLDFNTLYPSTNYSDIYLVMGPFAAGGTVLKNGDIAIGVEFFLNAQDSNSLGLPDYIKEVLKPSDLISTIVIHELVHFQQLNYAEQEGLNLSNRNLLEVTIAEGVAEYLAFLVTGRFTTMHLTDYYHSNEEELKRQFISEMHSSDYSNWLFNLGSGAEIPADLGYYVGFKMAEKHYQNHQSIEKLIEIKDADRFLEESGYLELEP